MFKISNIEYGMHSIYLVIEDCIKNLNKFLFVGAGAFLVPIFYAISFFDKSIVTKSAIITYWLLISIFIYVFSIAVKKIYSGKEINFFYSYFLLVSLGVAIFSMSFAELYAIKEEGDYKILNVYFYAAINTFIWKILFYFIKFTRFLLLYLSKKENFKKIFSKIKIENLLSFLFIILVFYHMILSLSI